MQLQSLDFWEPTTTEDFRGIGAAAQAKQASKLGTQASKPSKQVEAWNLSWTPSEGLLELPAAKMRFCIRKCDYKVVLFENSPQLMIFRGIGAAAQSKQSSQALRTGEPLKGPWSCGVPKWALVLRWAITMSWFLQSQDLLTPMHGRLSVTSSAQCASMHNFISLYLTSIYLSIYLSFTQSIYPPIHLSTCPSIQISHSLIHVSTRRLVPSAASLNPHEQLSIYLSSYPSIYLSALLEHQSHISVYLPIYVSIFLSIYLSALTLLVIGCHWSLHPFL